MFADHLGVASDIDNCDKPKLLKYNSYQFSHLSVTFFIHREMTNDKIERKAATVMIASDIQFTLFAPSPNIVY